MGSSDGKERMLNDYNGEERVEDRRFRWFRKMVKELSRRREWGRWEELRIFFDGYPCSL